jgi:hypothetical protein
MGNWGTGVFENDHASDLLSIETDRWATAFDKVIGKEDATWDDIEGPLLYVHLLALVAAEDGDLNLGDSVGRPASSRQIATAWKERYVELYKGKPTQNPDRRKVIDETFDALIAAASDEDD